MYSFRFNFSGEDSSHHDAGSKDDIVWLESKEVLLDKQIKELDKLASRAKIFTCGDVEIGHVLVSDAIVSIGVNEIKSSLELAEHGHSDLVTGKYEGGLKIWECTEDLVQYLVENEDKVNFNGKKVLDLGCGAGILGIYAFMKGANVTFQDYNEEVIRHVTIPNVLLNIEEEDKMETEIEKCKFYCGDWASFNNNLKDSEKFDVILTSETIYNESNYEKLLSLFLQRLNKDGVVFVAAKTYYFGVGGGTCQFQKATEQTGTLENEICWKSTGGIQREIIKITNKTKE